MTTERPFSQELWDQTPGAVQDDIRALEARVTALEAAVQGLEATVRQLTERLQHNSRTSSRPPSSDPPQAAAKRPQREPSGRRPGGQPGHEGHTRALVPLEGVDVVRPLKPERCRRCQHPLVGEDLHPQRHQVTDIPPVKPVVTEYQLHQLVCRACGEVTQAEWPAGVPTGGFGPRVQAIAALCTGAYHLSKRTTQSVLEDLFGVSLCVGTIAHLEQATVQAVAEPVAEARGYVQRQAAAYLDETGWREGRQRAWLWTAVTACVTVFVVRLSRGAKVAHELLGGALLGVFGDGPLERLYLVPRVAAAGVLGPPAAGHRSDDRARRTVPRDWGSLASASPPDVPLVASGPRRDTGTCQLCPLYMADPARGPAAVGNGANVRGPEDGGSVPGDPQGAPGIVDVCAP